MREFLDAFHSDELLPILDSISDAVFIDSKDGIALWCNKACYELYKVSPEEIYGKHVADLEKSGVFTPSVACLVMEQKKGVTIVHENKDGKRLLSTGIPIFDSNNHMTKIITTSRDITELVNLQHQLESVQNTLEDFKLLGKFSSDGMVANSHQMFHVLQLAKRLSDVDSTVLITGESGVGKGVIANLLHRNGRRKEKPLIKINCGAIPESLIESELFGYERGAFTGSRAEGKKGLFETAQDGTIFLDEISELPLTLQVKLLQVIQEKEITRVGGVKSIPIDVRIISATNKDLFELVNEKKFRADLYYRLNVVPINIPPLRERYEDIIPLIQHALRECNKKIHANKQIDSNAMAILLKYDWPGNVRELENIVERLVITTKEDIIMPENLPSFIYETTHSNRNKSLEPVTLKDALDKAEQELLSSAYHKHGSTRMIAKSLGISQPSVVRKLRKYGIPAE
ncbi:sigma-54 interaction domain-containing protein [Clostridium aminobutyricum]|uniref:HTH-type transcriptional regulatory protein TyrR n=1 Tax=Clostridium aminobutyricum TaxID=33953 RepID=A0A939IIR4_CLOAM|nr:sigma 54-interacting transcriptional regulator [Clostridium aminobutyricum]MBN7772828.1 sigma 54-interacting transcriptional regulator [Clostridium aminobutyricum]